MKCTLRQGTSGRGTGEDPSAGIDSVAGYVRVANPVVGKPSAHLPGSPFLLVVAVGSGPRPSSAPRVVGRMVLRGFTSMRIPNALLSGSASRPEVHKPLLPIGAHLRPVGRLVPLAGTQSSEPKLRALQNGQSFHITSPSERNLVTPALAQALETIFENFARYVGAAPQNPLPISLSRGYDANDLGHAQGNAADISAVGGKGLSQWKRDWESAVAHARALPPGESQRILFLNETQHNLGYQLYQALLQYGGWRIYNNVAQLFGPWTDILGPWSRLKYEQPDEAQRRLLDEQDHVFQAHQNHIHVARD